MPTLVLNAYSKAYPFISNRIKASVRTETSGAIIASIIDTTAGHPQRVWSFPGLPRNNYQFSLDEIDGGGAVVNNLALFSVVPGEIDGLLTRDDEQIQVGSTTGFDIGATSATFDGTGGKPNYIGWEIVPSELTGRGILVEGQDYSWDKLTGVFSLLIVDDNLQDGMWYNIHFNPILNPAGNSYPTITDFSINKVIASITIDESYFGKKLLAEPAGDYIEITLPDILTVPQGRRMMVEVGGDGVRCVKFTPVGGSLINWNSGVLYAIAGECFSIYVYERPSVAPEWRICEAFGNFRDVGRNVSCDSDIVEQQDKHFMNGASVSKFKYARLYEQFVLNLDPSQVVDYDDWATADNKYFYSLANSTDPSHVDEFHLPDRRGVFERNNTSGKSGDYAADKLKAHGHRVNTGGNGTGANPGKSLIRQSYNGDGYGSQGTGTGSGGPYIEVAGDDETAPKSYLINKFILV